VLYHLKTIPTNGAKHNSQDVIYFPKTQVAISAFESDFLQSDFNLLLLMQLEMNTSTISTHPFWQKNCLKKLVSLEEETACGGRCWILQYY
jgi:hypothetical protein